MSDERLRRLYQRGIAARDARDERDARDARDGRGATACDVPPEELLALARGELPEERRLELLDMVMRSERCRSEFELLRAVVVAGRDLGDTDEEDACDIEDADADGMVEERPGTTMDPVLPPPTAPDVIPFGPTERARRREAGRRGTRGTVPWWRRTSVPVALAATALVAIGLSRFVGEDAPPADVMRGSDDGVVTVAPAEEIAAGARPVFVWRAVPGAARYRFELLDVDGNLLHEAVTTDTSVVLPESVTLDADVEHRWIVRATDQLGVQLGSAVRALRVE